MINVEFLDQETIHFKIPNFRCSVCHIGVLLPKKESTIEATTKRSEQCYNMTGDPECYDGYFTAISHCNNPDCQEITTIIGETKTVQDGWDDGLDADTYEYLHEPMPIYKTRYLVTYTNPAIQLIEFSKNTPKEIVDLLNESFILFWVDENSCGNKIRNSIEKILDLKKIRKTTISKNRKRQYLKLHNRIDLFGKLYPEIEKYLFALKWIGNQGSHNDVYKLNKSILIDAYKIIEITLLDLYGNERFVINRLSNRINKNKRHRSK